MIQYRENTIAYVLLLLWKITHVFNNADKFGGYELRISKKYNVAIDARLNVQKIYKEWSIPRLSIFISINRICDVIWETMHKVGKHDFKIFMASHRGETEKYSEKKLSQKLNSMLRYEIPKVKVAES